MAAAPPSPHNDYLFGWEMLYRTIEPVIQRKTDILVALAHFVFMNYANFRCLGLGEQRTYEAGDITSELLPDGWNANETKYALRYLHVNKVYILIGTLADRKLLLNLLDVSSQRVSNVFLDPEELVQQLRGSIYELIPTAGQLSERYRKELVDAIFAGHTTEGATQTSPPPPAPPPREPLRDLRVHDPLRVYDPLRVSDPMRAPGSFVPAFPGPPPFGFPDVGRGDLDPLGRGGPGNLMPFPERPDAMRNGHVNPRFDPFGPPEREIRRNPNNDHFRPPGFGDDFYS